MSQVGYESLLALIPEDSEDGVHLREVIEERHRSRENARSSYGGWRKHNEHMEKMKATAPLKILELLMSLQMKIDAMGIDNPDEWEEANLIVFNPDDQYNLMDAFGDLIAVVNDSDISPAKKNMGEKSRLNRAQILAKAHDPLDTDWGFCPKCSRPMAKSYIETHQKNTLVCVEIKSGRNKTLEVGRTKGEDIGNHIAERVFVDPNDSEDE